MVLSYMAGTTTAKRNGNSCQTMDSPERPMTVALIIIGDELLKGHVKDINTHYLCHQLWLLGVEVCRVAIVSDTKKAIADEVKRFASTHDFVITTGGVGPTHDDITVEAVGEAFEEQCVLHPDLLRVLFGEKGDDPSSPWRKMAYAPKSTKVHVKSTEDLESSWLLLTIHNVHCYPGVPSLLKSVFQSHKELYCGRSSVQFHMRELHLSCGEDTVVTPLSQVQEEFPDTQLGSYPDTTPGSSYHLKLTVESVCKNQVDKAYTRLALLLPKDVMMSSQYKCSNSADTMSAEASEVSWLLADLPPGTASLLPDSLCAKVATTLSVMEKTYKKYSFDEVCVAFNGGKDCTMMLNMLHALLKRRGHDFSSHKIPVLYIHVDHNAHFPEVTSFVEEAAEQYSLDLIQVSGADIKDALFQLKARHPAYKAIMMGTRKTDPYSAKLTTFAPTDDDWPKYMRVNTILDWGYLELWLFMRIMTIPYCYLYDQGYTSLDGMKDTYPNPHLAVTHKTRVGQRLLEAGSYLPAYMLSSGEHEREGRHKR